MSLYVVQWNQLLVGGAKYFLLCVDDHSRMSFIYFLNNENPALDSFENFKNLVEYQVKTKVKILRTDDDCSMLNLKKCSGLKL